MTEMSPVCSPQVLSSVAWFLSELLKSEGDFIYLLIRSVRVGVSEGDLMPSYRYLMPTYIQAYMDTYK